MAEPGMGPGGAHRNILAVVYRQPGVRIAEVRVTAHRDDSGTFGGAQNLARMRVTVTE
ncbi:MAG: hypothetical protein U5N53_06800 [Mycobacterium sp.]|nr:hypothetical protein [Mycobacterium sp.]